MIAAKKTHGFECIVVKTFKTGLFAVQRSRHKSIDGYELSLTIQLQRISFDIDRALPFGSSAKAPVR
jgi:hypothetical protein